jgi:hypothetical protein
MKLLELLIDFGPELGGGMVLRDMGALRRMHQRRSKYMKETYDQCKPEI